MHWRFLYGSGRQIQIEILSLTVKELRLTNLKEKIENGCEDITASPYRD